MRIGIIGPTRLNSLEEVNENAIKIIRGLSKLVAESGNEIVITPDNGSVSEFFAKEYVNYGGKKVYCIVPLDDKEFGFSWLNLKLGENINCNIWRNQPEKLNEETDFLLCLGYAEGVLIEMAYSKWFKPKPVKIIKELVSEQLPKESIKKVDLEYVSHKNLKFK
jgi:hypothetical protein